MGKNEKQTIEGESDVPYRRRGRPAGKNRIPLSQEERRARNAQYERERRNETAEVISQLVEAVNCDPKISNADLLATVISRIQRATRKKSESISDLQRINANLEAQILSLQGRLGLDDASLEQLSSEDDDETPNPYSNIETSDNNCIDDNYNLRQQLQRKKRKRSERQSSDDNIQQEKRTKTRSETWSVDSGIEMRGQTVSPETLTIQDKTEYLIQSEPLPVEITEEQQYHICESHFQLQTELYNQIYNSESQSSSESTPRFPLETLSAETQSMPCIESLARSLIVVPPIIPPQQEPPDSQDYTQPDLRDLENIELPSDFDISNAIIANDRDFQPQDDNQQLIYDILTDSEKGLLCDWVGADFIESSEFTDHTQDIQARSNVLSGY